ncbi:MAG: cobalt transporter [Syntrophorhabdales bacterium]|jgi:ABC-type spermidine/putrescine transport system permease subunit II
MKTSERSFLYLCAGCAFLLALLLIPAYMPLNGSESGAKWQGVDESVVEKVAHEHGREIHAPLINTDQGDLLLFVFLMAGVVGGFAAGYYWRSLTEQKEVQARKGGE